jgi:hypothetical protein
MAGFGRQEFALPRASTLLFQTISASSRCKRAPAKSASRTCKGPMGPSLHFPSRLDNTKTASLERLTRTTTSVQLSYQVGRCNVGGFFARTRTGDLMAGFERGELLLPTVSLFLFQTVSASS